MRGYFVINCCGQTPPGQEDRDFLRDPG